MDKMLVKENLYFAYFPESDTNLFNIIMTNPSDALTLANKTALDVLVFFDSDLFKISTLLNISLYNINKMLVSNLPLLKNFYYIDESPKLTFDIHETTQNIIEKYLYKIEEIINSVKILHINNKNSLVRKICEYVLSNTDNKLTIEAMSEHLGYSRRYISKVFKDNTDESLVAYITKAKMLRAKTLLKQGKHKNYEISNILGYKKVDYFTQLFKDEYGFTPKDYKQTL